ncbi:hypothetical protein [Micromonospora sp. S-DT3-3-22]|uniref:hypothetical protein n=1 Tax=Micromonospora sp. S-DT3-3-22 TaxID=2755359 RepID=UPI0018905F0F|nr:hypothetical protein [Micromonospora sp. S-DT3-3-22]
MRPARNQVVLAWPLRQGIRPNVGVSSIAQLDEAVDAVHVPLEDGHMARLAGAR